MSQEETGPRGEPSCCCSPSSSSSCGSSGGGDCCAPAIGSTSRWKIIAFVLIVGAALAVLAHGLLKKPADAQAAPGSFSSLTEDAGTAKVSPSALCGSPLPSVAALDKVAADREAVFILLPADNTETDRKASREVQAAISTLTSKGKQVAAFTVEKANPDHGRLLQRFSMGALPAVVVAGRGCGSTAVSGEISEDKLLQAFLAATTPSSCGPSGCAPSSCR